MKSLTFKPKYVFYIFTILILTLVDGTMTIFLVEKGAWEANPLMRYALSRGHEFFFILKYFLTASGLLFLLLNGTRRVFKDRIIIEDIVAILIILYEGLIIYQIGVYHFVT